MCGILGVFANRKSRGMHRNLYTLYFDQYNRGTQGAGALIKNTDGLHRLRTGHPGHLFAYYNARFWRKAQDGSIIIMHHRWPTSTDNLPKCNHPIANEDKTIYIIHNGVMSNTKKDLKDTHTFETEDGKKFTDSEIVVHILEEQLAEHKGNMQEAIKSLPKRLAGSYAIAIVHEKEHRIYLLKNYMPIIISKDADGNTYFSSELKDSRLARIKEMKSDEIGFIDSDGYHTIVEGTEYKTQFLADWKDKGKGSKKHKPIGSFKEKVYSDWSGWDASYWRDLDEKAQAMAESHRFTHNRMGAW